MTLGSSPAPPPGLPFSFVNEHVNVISRVQQTQYGNPMIYVTENGVSEKMLCTDLCDDWRMKYFKDYINEMLKGECVLQR